MDNIVNKATEHGPYTYGYDSLYRLVTADGGPLTAEKYTYDPVGNRLTSSSANNWNYNQNNELQGYNGVTFEYDLNGNTTQRNDNGSVQNFLYNEDDRLTEVKDGNGAVVATYYYDPFGRRLWKEVGGTRTYFMYADEGLVAEMDGTGSETKSYGYAPNSTWTTNPLFMKQGTEYYFYHNDHLGTPQKMTAVNGSIVWSAKYESFGKAVVDPASTLVNNLRFPGQYYDNENGLHYNWHRMYQPSSGRYETADPIGVFAGDLNTYQYAYNIPLIHSDPQGLWVHGFGIGSSGACYLGAAGSLLFVADNVDNYGIVTCASGSLGYSKGWIAGLQINYSWGVEGICDLEGITFDIRDNGGGMGFADSWGATVDINRKGISTIMGRGRGRYGVWTNLVTRCKLLWSKKPCKEEISECERVYGAVYEDSVRYTRVIKNKGTEQIVYRIPGALNQ
jgi:RHS repeat-associated protein